MRVKVSVFSFIQNDGCVCGVTVEPAGEWASNSGRETKGGRVIRQRVCVGGGERGGKKRM